MKNLPLITLFVLFFVPLNVTAQETVDVEIIYEDELTTISVRPHDCISEKNGTAKTYLLLELSNRSDAEISISFKKNLWYDGECVSCNSSSDEFTITEQLSSGQSISGGCDSNNQLRIFVKMIELKGVRQLSKYELEDIQVSKL